MTLISTLQLTNSKEMGLKLTESLSISVKAVQLKLYHML